MVSRKEVVAASFSFSLSFPILEASFLGEHIHIHISASRSRWGRRKVLWVHLCTYVGAVVTPRKRKGCFLFLSARNSVRPHLLFFLLFSGNERVAAAIPLSDMQKAFLHLSSHLGTRRKKKPITLPLPTESLFSRGASCCFSEYYSRFSFLFRCVSLLCMLESFFLETLIVFGGSPLEKDGKGER